jgi:transposase
VATPDEDGDDVVREDHQDPPRGRTPLPAAVVRPHSGTGRRQPPLRPGTGGHQGAWPGRAPAHPARRRCRGQDSSRANRAYLRRRRIRCVIPEKADQVANRKKKGSRGGRPVGHDPDLYKDRNTVERCINKIKEWRGLATRYDKTATGYLAGLHLRGAVIWIRSLRPT